MKGSLVEQSGVRKLDTWKNKIVMISVSVPFIVIVDA